MFLVAIAAMLVVAAFFMLPRGRAAAGVRTEPELPVGWSADARWRVAPQLARVEARRLLLHPAFVVGVLVTPIMLLGAVESESTAFRASTSLALGMVPLGWMTIIAADLIALRSRRSHVDELFASLPAPYSVRTAGFLLLTPVAFVLAVVLLAVAGTGVVVFLTHDIAGDFALSEIAAGPLIVAGSVGLGVAVARWLPGAAWGVVAMFATLFVQARFLDTATWPWNSTESDLRRFLGFLASPTSATSGFEVRRSGWHLVYLVGLVLLIAIVALARHGWDRRIVGGGLAIALTIAVVAGVAQTRRPSAEQVAAMVAVLEHPATEQTCAQHDQVSLCAFPATPSGRVQQWRDRVDAVLAAVPAAARRPLEVRQRPAAIVGRSNCLPGRFVESLPPEVAAAIDIERVWPADGNVHPALGPDQFGCSGGDPLGGARDLFVAIQMGAWAVGLPPAPHAEDVRCTADGQARSVVALWLGAQATPGGADLLGRTLDEGNDGSRLTFPEWDERPVLGVSYTKGDVLTALAILTVAPDRVVAVLEKNWATLIDARTPASTFAEFFGLAGARDAYLEQATPCG